MADAIEVEPGVWSVIEGTRSYEVRFARGTAGSSAREIRVDGTRIEASIKDSREWDPAGAGEIAKKGAQIKAPMPGKVIRVLVEPGQQVTAGQGVIVVEAMKMQNELKSPREGRVSAITAREHQAVNAGMVLMTIE